MTFTSYQRDSAKVTLEWGRVGAEALGPLADVVDVLSFTTAVTVACDRGIAVYPYDLDASAALEFAIARGAKLAVSRRAAGEDDVSLSPSSLRNAAHVSRVVLPSPNGSSICHLLLPSSVVVLAASLRNRRAVASWLTAARAEDPELTVAIIPAGERWPDGSLRAVVEDLWGAGGVVAALIDDGWASLSVEARMAAGTFRAAAGDIGSQLAGQRAAESSSRAVGQPT